MIESIMYFCIGFLTASLFILIIIPPIHNRAVRLTTRQLEALVPLSQSEMRAERDQLRAQCAVAVRRQEVRVDELRAKMASQVRELGDKIHTINELTLQLIQRSATIFSLEAQQMAIKDELSSVREQLARLTAAGGTRVVEMT